MNEPGARLEESISRFTDRIGILSRMGGARLPARRSRPSAAWESRVLDSANVDHRKRPAAEQDLASGFWEDLHENRSPASSSADRVADSFREVVAGLSRGPQGPGSESGHLSCDWGYERRKGAKVTTNRTGRGEGGSGSMRGCPPRDGTGR